MSLNSGISTGLASYSLRKEFLGDSAIFYRETEIFGYEIYAIPSFLQPSGFSQIETLLKNEFANRSGDITVKSLGVPAEYQFPNDHVRAARFNVQVEIRRVPTGITGLQPELLGNYYSGLGGSFFNLYSNILDSFSEDFAFSNEDNGNKSFNHSCSFVLRSGGKGKATEVASGLFSSDKDTTFGISAMIGGISGADTGVFQNYYTETYDLIKNAFSFSKKREFLPFDSAAYLYNLIHSINLQENGIIEVSEKGDIQGKLTFGQAQQGYDNLKLGSFNRCSGVYSSYKDIIAGASVSSSLINLALSSNKTLIKPSLNISYDVKYTDDPNLDSNNLISVEKVLDVDLVDNKFININHTQNFTILVNPAYPNMDNDFVGVLISYASQSPSEVQNYYVSSPFYNPNWPTENQIKFTSNLPNRRKTFSFTASYTNNPINFFTLDGYQYKIFDYKITDVIPPDIINEYKVINRPSKTSVLNYAYQTEKGSKSISITARLIRPADVFLAPVSDLSTNLLSVYRFGVSKLMSTFFGLNTLSLVYYLSDVKYRFNSDSELVLDLVITYAIKKYTA